MNNVIEMKPQSGYEDVLFFLQGTESRSTYNRYKTAIERFVDKQFDKPLEHLQPEDVLSLNYMDMEKYRNYLKRKFAANSVNNEMTAIFNLFKQLNKIQRDGKYVYDINVERLRTKSLKVSDVESSGDIQWDEVTNWIQHLDKKDVANKQRKMTFLHLARVSGFRKESLAQLTFKDLYKRNGITWQLKTTLKGSTKRVSLKDRDAEMLLELWEDKNNRDEKILKMSTKTMERLLSKVIIPDFNIPEERNVTLHSLRGLSIWEVYISSGYNIVVAKEHAGHKNIETTYNYIKRRMNDLEQPTLYMGEEFSDKDLKGLDMGDMKKLFNNLSRSAQYEILNK